VLPVIDFAPAALAGPTRIPPASKEANRMYSFLISAVLGGASFALLFLGLDQHWGIALAVALVVALASWLGVTWWANKQLEKKMPAIEQALTNQKPEVAVKLLEEAREMQKWSLPVGMAIDGQLGIIHYAHKQDLETAKPLLEKAFVKNWQAKAMLAALHYKRKKFDEMEKVFEDTIKSNKKESLLYASYAWCQARRRKRDEAVAILERGRKELPDDEELKQAISAVQSGKKMKMSGWEPEWWALHLQRPPARVISGGRKVQGRYIRRQ